MTPARWRAALVGLGLLAAALHLGTINNNLTFDDHWAIERNPTLAKPWDVPAHFGAGFWGPGWEEHDAAWRPMTTLTLAWNFALHGARPAGYFLVNLLLHALASVLLALLARELGLRLGWAFAAGALYAVHPVHVEAIAAGVGRADLLMGMAGIGALLAWERRRFAVALVALAVAMFAKEMGVMVALVIAWREWTRGGLRLRPPASWRWVWPLAVVALWLVCRFMVLGTLGNAHPGYLENPLAYESVGTRLLTAGDVYRRAVQLFAVPVTLVADYSYATVPPVHGLAVGAVVGWLLLLGTVAATVWAGRKHPALALMLGLWIGPYLLVSHLGPTLPMIFAERVLYLPSAGLCLLVAFGGSRLQRWPLCEQSAGLALLVVCGLFAARSYVRVQDWQSDSVLFPVTARDAPRGVKPLCNAARIYMELGDMEAAFAAARQALAVREQSFLPHLTLAELYINAGDPGQARAFLAAAEQRQPDVARFDTAKCAFAAKFAAPDAAVIECERAIRRRYAGADAWMFMGIAYDKSRRPADGEQAFLLALSKGGGANVTTLANYGRFLANNGRLDEAERAVRDALEIAPGRRDLQELLRRMQADPRRGRSPR